MKIPVGYAVAVDTFSYLRPFSQKVDIKLLLSETLSI